MEVIDNIISDGQYKIGTDIPAGEYNVRLNAKGYMDAVKSSHDNRNMIVNKFSEEPSNKYVTLVNGDYLFLRNAEVNLNEIKKVSEPPINAESTQQTRIVTLGMDYLTFNSNFNENAAAFDERFIWSVGDAKTQDGVQKVFTYQFTPYMIMQGAMYPSNEQMKEVWVVSNAKNDSERIMLTRLYALLIKTLQREISDSEVKAIMNEVTQRDGAEVVKRGVRYKMAVIPNTGLMFSASAKDL